MQKVLQRSKYAKQYANKRIQARKEKLQADEVWELRQTHARQNREKGALYREARTNRQVDWKAGPLAPRRDVGEKAHSYGAMSVYNFQPPDLYPQNRPKWCGITEGDRVVVVKGRDKGTIAEVQEVFLSRGSLQLRDSVKQDIVLPEYLRARQEQRYREQSQDPNAQVPVTQAVPAFIPLEDVRLVYPLPDPKTGVPRDVIIERLVSVNRQFDKAKKEWTDGERLIPGTKTLIPWPEKADTEYADHEVDTLRIDVDARSYRPSLIEYPMPPSVIDELRSKYSKFRTRHEYEFRERKEAEDEKMERRKRLPETMRTPLQELAAKREAERRETERELSEEQLAGIGAVIAQEQEKIAQAVAGKSR